ncbi:serine/threonine protein kinase [Streptacidiphilus sp. ASG 303]|uniref:serine/threonine-protein kinase n=1 Tax=Streptacidiphilus sp. ASG 303 TaxID=2896847 RepID=UPI001E61311F|nr:serine/threonine-protein kinase [Streptacidiphilus sp. ASG 303]MCD0484074.1 serine/threonine protein kinase [Streptacidiphilus sp. ASG 303]
MHDHDTASADAGAERLVAGRYRLLAVLGAGGMGTVWRARDEVLHREVAVKEVRTPAGLAADRVAQMYARLEREAWAAARISARGVVTVHDVATHDGRPWIVMEFVRGRSLADVLAARGALPPREAAHVGAEVLAALGAAHDAGVLHRDVKPANVLLADDGRVVLTDFGIASVEGDPGLTMAGELVGSPEYVAPERALGRTPGPASDLWSLGALLYTAVQGRSPFRRTTPLATLRAVVDEDVPPPDRAGPLAPVIESLMRKDPAERMTAGQAGRELRLAAAAGREGAGPAAPHAAVTDGTATVEFPAGRAAPDATAPSPVPGGGTDAGTTAATVDAPTVQGHGAPGDGRTTADVPGPSAARTAATTMTTATVGTPTVDAPLGGPTATAEQASADGQAAAAAGTAVPAPRLPGDAASAPTVDSPVVPGAPPSSAVPPSAVAPSAAPPSAAPRRAPTAAPAARAAGSPAVGADPAGPAPVAAPPTAAAASEPPDTGASGSGSARRSRRTGYLVSAAVVVTALLAGGLSHALVGGDREDRTGGDQPAGRTQSAAAGAVGSGQDGTAAQRVAVTVTGDATAYVGECPPADSAGPVFTATFTVSEVPVRFSYRWVSANGSVVDRQWRTLSFPEGGPRTHRETVRLSTYAQAGTLRSAMAVEIRSPFHAVSDPVPFSVTCLTAGG